MSFHSLFLHLTQLKLEKSTDFLKSYEEIIAFSETGIIKNFYVQGSFFNLISQFIWLIYHKPWLSYFLTSFSASYYFVNEKEGSSSLIA
jgi:hypothetical protein